MSFQREFLTLYDVNCDKTTTKNGRTIIADLNYDVIIVDNKDAIIKCGDTPVYIYSKNVDAESTDDIKVNRKTISSVSNKDSSNLSYLLNNYENIFISIDFDENAFNWLSTLSHEYLSHIKQISIKFTCPFNLHRWEQLISLSESHILCDITGNGRYAIVSKDNSEINDKSIIKIGSSKSNTKKIGINVSDNAKIYTLSKTDFNFSYKVENGTLTVKRTDKNGGWKLDLEAVIQYDYSGMVTVGGSQFNEKIISFPEYIQDNIDGDIKVFTYPNGYDDTFEYTYNSRVLMVKRTDANTGWGQNLKVIITSNNFLAIPELNTCAFIRKSDAINPVINNDRLNELFPSTSNSDISNDVLKGSWIDSAVNYYRKGDILYSDLLSMSGHVNSSVCRVFNGVSYGNSDGVLSINSILYEPKISKKLFRITSGDTISEEMDGIEYCLMSADCSKLIEENFDENIKAAFDKTESAVRDRMAKLCLIYIYGGVYSDYNINVNRYLIPDKEVILTLNGEQFSEDTFACEKGHPFIMECIKKLADAIEKEENTDNIFTECALEYLGQNRSVANYSNYCDNRVYVYDSYND